MMNKNGFTLTEIMVAVVIIGCIAAFAVPVFEKTIRKSEERSAVLQLKKIHGRNLLEIKRTGDCLPGNIALSHTGLETNFGVNYGGMDYSYGCTGGNGVFTAMAAWPAGINKPRHFVLRVTEAAISDSTYFPNPCCFSGSCLVTPPCQ